MKKNANLLATFQKLKSLLGGDEKQHKRTLVITLIVIELLLITCAIISYNNKTLDKYVFGSRELKNTNLFAVMIEDENGEYKESSSDTFPGYEYFYNQAKSSCMDNTGKPIADSLLYNQDTKTASITVSDTSSCYLYFDMWRDLDKNYHGTKLTKYLVNKGEMWQSGLEGDGYRYVGPNPNNYICFGTTDLSECTSNPDKYMYRIIGVFSDNNKIEHAKLIKYTLLDEMIYGGNSSYYSPIESWKDSTIYQALNGSAFLTNTLYDYMQDTSWSDRIENWTWSAVNTKTSDGSNGPNYQNGLTPSQIYLHEMNRSTKTSTVGEWTTPSAKIGLMYVSDYALSLGKNALKLTSGTYDNRAILKTGWLHSSNINGQQSIQEWTLSLYGNYDDYYYHAWGIGAGGYVYTDYTFNSNYVRPTFYLNNNQTVSSGTGSIDNPIILSQLEINELSIKVNNSGPTLTATITKGIGKSLKYCINNKLEINDCKWKSVTTSTIIYEMPKNGKYYVHVIDDAGYIANSYVIYSFADLLVNKGEMWQSGLEGDGYRYVGTGSYNSASTPSNFVCFGTDDKSTCTSNPDDYMYRIIGIFDNKIKLIKLTSLSKNYIYDDNTIVVPGFYHLDIASSINDKTLYSYMQDNHWYNMLSSYYDDTFVDTLTVDENGPNYYNSVTPTEIYLHETNRSTKSNTIGSWDTTYNKKISLMRASDYVLSLGETAKSMTTGTYSNRNTLKTSWLFLGNNRYGNTSGNYTTEQLFARAGEVSGSGLSRTTYNWTINASGYLNYVNMKNAYAVRPVFFLEKSVISTSGTGTYTDPYILDN